MLCSREQRGGSRSERYNEHERKMESDTHRGGVGTVMYSSLPLAFSFYFSLWTRAF